MNKGESMNTELSSDLKRIKHDVTSAPLENCDFVSDLYDSKHIILIKTENKMKGDKTWAKNQRMTSGYFVSLS